MRPRSRTPALWILGSHRRPSSTADLVDAERRKAGIGSPLTTPVTLNASLRVGGFEADWRRGAPDDPIPLLLRLRSPARPEIDVVCTTRAWEREILARSIRIRIAEGLEIPVLALEDLIVLKLMAGGPGDLADVIDLLDRVGPLPELDRRAAARGVSDLLRQVRASRSHPPQPE